ncbi:peptide/nickel transport system substrate-binding protein [Streptomyces sp. DvalAA-14]|uniref:ABC transporter family substrate-binding protein n=1 Tax=unclassified Streptomyces TaxID=2593676 RepID=UPI00081B9546|nr:MULTISPECIES: ABC transporter family substrate-binding protein [unclassified Streptomyces]MYS20253.1 ABC transporter family substrate-binding protein [Streptomyces sp. SID4948]SCD64654.1 peptide/nickel transport system substrate-binding protein [Streptomyces sp. DvalAA-14]
MRRKFGRAVTAVAVALSAALLTAGCSSSSDHADTSKDAASRTSSAAPAVGSQEINPQPAGKVKQGGTFTAAIQQWIPQWNFYQVDGTQGDAQSIVVQVEPSLFTYDAQGVSQLDKDFLVSADVTATSPQVVTYTLNPKARWSDGRQLSWQDFATQWKALRGSDDRYLVADTSGYDQISAVTRGADDQQVKITFSKPYADWKRLFRPLLPAPAIATPDLFNKGWLEKVPITGNSWKISSYDKTAQTVTTVPDPHWWGSRPKLDSIIYRALDASADTDAYLNKEIDYAPAIQPEDYKRLAEAPDTDIRSGARWDEVHITLNGARGPLRDLSVRQAVDLAIDRQGILASFSKDLPFPVEPLGNHFFMPNQQGYQDNSGKWGRYDLAGAKKLLDAAGWKDNGAGKPRTKDGASLTLRYVLSAGSSSSATDQAQLVQAQLGAAGIAVKIQTVPADDFFTKYVNTGAFDLVSFRNVDAVFHTMLYSTFQAPSGTQVYGNFGRISTPQIQQLLTEAAATTDQAKSDALYNQADAKIWEQVHSIELYQRPQIVAVRKGLANFGASGLADTDYNTMGWTS